VSARGLLRSGDPFIWLTGGGVAVAILMVIGLVGLIFANGLSYFAPKHIVRLELAGGEVVTGQVVAREEIPGAPGEFRVKLRVGNRDLYGAEFRWIDEARIRARGEPPWVAVIERTEWGPLIGEIVELRVGGQAVATGAEASMRALAERLAEAQELAREIFRLERREIGSINAAQERVRLRRRTLELAGVTAGPTVAELDAELAELEARYAGLEARAAELRSRQDATLVASADAGLSKELPLADVVDAYLPNRMSAAARAWHHVRAIWHFVSDDPRESNTEGGVFPAIFGTVLLVFLMTLVVTPLGVLAAFYLREYARQGPFVSTVRIAVNNLAGVPSIVFGVFGVGFFLYGVGGAIDRVFFPEALPTPTFGTGGILWASLTLALLTVPVVIVATEEGLAAVPRGLREASYALGATKLETTLRVVLPAVLPSILTGLILSIARASGEVAPLMITGVVKLAPSLPIDSSWPFLHLDRKFMHLGFHIYDVGFQSPNVDAARPMVFATASLLLLLVVLLNLLAIWLRNRLRRRYAGSAV
jgi:phosphate transport system permease protein